MAHISTAVEYATHCLLYLVSVDDIPPRFSIKDLAQMQGVPPQYLAKIFTKLRQANLVQATEGLKGGFQLARPAAEISMLDIVHAVDGDKSLFDCQNIRTRCALFNQQPPSWATAGLCSIHAVMVEAEQKMKESLSHHTLDSINNILIEKAPADYSDQISTWFNDKNSHGKLIANTERTVNNETIAC